MLIHNPQALALRPWGTQQVVWVFGAWQGALSSSATLQSPFLPRSPAEDQGSLPAARLLFTPLGAAWRKGLNRSCCRSAVMFRASPGCVSWHTAKAPTLLKSPLLAASIRRSSAKKRDGLGSEKQSCNAIYLTGEPRAGHQRLKAGS